MLGHDLGASSVDRAMRCEVGRASLSSLARVARGHVFSRMPDDFNVRAARREASERTVHIWPMTPLLG